MTTPRRLEAEKRAQVTPASAPETTHGVVPIDSMEQRLRLLVSSLRTCRAS